jgi:hypothetical protein
MLGLQWKLAAQEETSKSCDMCGRDNEVFDAQGKLLGTYPFRPGDDVEAVARSRCVRSAAPVSTIRSPIECTKKLTWARAGMAEASTMASTISSSTVLMVISQPLRTQK